jgi:hypothetical protein
MIAKLDTAIQIGSGVAVVTLVYLLSTWIMQRNQILDNEIAYSRPSKLEVDVLRGYGNLSRLVDKQWSTMNQGAGNFLPIVQSYNRRGGLQFTYSFWIKVDTRSGGADVAQTVLLLRGDRRLFSWRRHTAADPDKQTPERVEEFGPDVLLKCPLIRFGKAFDEVVVEFNTLSDPNASFKIASSPASGPGGDRRNALSLIQGKWCMMTFAFEDNVGISNFEDGIMVRFYLNDDLYHTHRQLGAFKRNQGDLHVAPNGDRDNANINIGDIRYFNYAVSPSSVATLYRAGPPKHQATDLEQRNDGEPLYLSEYNKLDIYNST